MLNFLIGSSLYTLIFILIYFTVISTKPKVQTKYREINILGTENFRAIFYDGKNRGAIINFNKDIVHNGNKIVNLQTKQTIPINRWVIVRKEDNKIFALTDSVMSLFY